MGNSDRHVLSSHVRRFAASGRIDEQEGDRSGARHCADGSGGFAPDLCSRGVRPGLLLTESAGGFLPGVPLGCLGMGDGSPSGPAHEDQRRLKRRVPIPSMQTAVVNSRVTAAVEDLRLLYGAVEKPTDNSPSRSLFLRGEECAEAPGPMRPIIRRIYNAESHPNRVRRHFIARQAVSPVCFCSPGQSEK